MTTTQVPRWTIVSITLGAILLGGAGAVAAATYRADDANEAATQPPKPSPSATADGESELNQGNVVDQADPVSQDDLVGPSSVVAPVAPDPEPTLTAGPDVVAGTDLGSEPVNLGSSLRAYERADGSYVAVDPATPLPEDVVADMTTQAVGAITAGADTDTLTATIAKENYAKAMHAGTGRWVVIVSPGTGTKADQNNTDSGWAFWAHDDTISHTSVVTSKELAIQDAQKWIAERPDPGTYELLVTE